MNAEEREKRRVTIVSVAAAAVLTALKLIVGLATGSLGLISEAMHSGLDFVASVLTLFSVRAAGRPADADHPYGHGRFENLSATIQGLLLIATATAIIVESLRRIFFENVPVESSVWTFAVMGTSIVIDVWRSRMLLDAARRYHSQALEADALNFRADLYSSGVVIVGLALTYYGERTGRGWLGRADAVAAFVVALLIIRMSGKLALNAVQVLLDRAPGDLAERITTELAAVRGVLRAPAVRVRESGQHVFVDVVVEAARSTSLEEAHAITERVEASVQRIEPRARALVHVEPVAHAHETAAERLRAVALRLGLDTHHERVVEVEGRLEATLHLEVGAETTLREAYAVSERLEAALQADNPALARVDTHIEVGTPDPIRWAAAPATDERARAIQHALRDAGCSGTCHEVRMYEADGGGWGAVLHCDFPADLPMREIHQHTEQIEHALRERLSGLDYVLVHAEPRDS